MNKITTETTLQDAILLLEREKAEKGKLIKEEFHATSEKLKPVNIVKNVRKMAASKSKGLYI